MPIILQLLNIQLFGNNTFIIHRIIEVVVSGIWYMAVADYMCHYANNYKFRNWIYLINASISVIMLIGFIVSISGIQQPLKSISMFILYFMLGLFLLNTVLMVIVVRRVLNERNVLFLALEMLIVVLGMANIAEEIEKLETEKKNATENN